jgi:hypothetical protein
MNNNHLDPLAHTIPAAFYRNLNNDLIIEYVPIKSGKKCNQHDMSTISFNNNTSQLLYMFTCNSNKHDC